MQPATTPDTRRSLQAAAKDRLRAIEGQMGAILGLPPWHAAVRGFDKAGRPVFGVYDRTGLRAVNTGLDPITAQLVAWAATRRAGVSPIACLWHPEQRRP